MRQRSRSPAWAVRIGRAWPLTSTRSPSRPRIRAMAEGNRMVPAALRVMSEITRTRSRVTGNGPDLGLGR